MHATRRYEAVRQVLARHLARSRSGDGPECAPDFHEFPLHVPASRHDQANRQLRRRATTCGFAPVLQPCD